mgnify:CR=1 FL=1
MDSNSSISLSARTSTRPAAAAPNPIPISSRPIAQAMPRAQDLPRVQTPIAVDEGYWGYHLILDARGCDVATITDRQTLDRFIRTLVRDIEMTAYGEPVIEHFATHDIEKAGYSLVQLIETSSITGHFVDKNGDAYIDVFSCKPYPIETVKSLVQRFFRPKSMRVTYLTRQA